MVSPFPKLPLASEPHLDAWKQYATETEEASAWEMLRQKLVQLKFQVQKGICDTESYKNAVRRGVWIPDIKIPGLEIENPEGIRLEIHPTIAGNIPIVTIESRNDFLSFIRALCMKNKPEPIPKSVGAFIVSGYNNWDRIRQYKKKWMSENPFFNTEATWNNELNRLKQEKPFYQDTFVLLSAGPYSGVDSEEIGLSKAEWNRYSKIIRLEHECAHYAVQRIFGGLNENLMDEFIADFAGIVAAFKTFRPDLMIKFMGLEKFPDSHPENRIHYYRGKPPLSDGAFIIQKKLYLAAVENIAEFLENDEYGTQVEKCRILLLIALAGMTMEEVASVEMKNRLGRSVGHSVCNDPLKIYK